jgi:hypothetical protein
LYSLSSCTIGIFTRAFTPLPDGDVQQAKIDLLALSSVIRAGISWTSSKSKVSNPDAFLKDALFLLLKSPPKVTTGSCNLIAFLSLYQ